MKNSREVSTVLVTVGLTLGIGCLLRHSLAIEAGVVAVAIGLALRQLKAVSWPSRRSGKTLEDVMMLAEQYGVRPMPRETYQQLRERILATPSLHQPYAASTRSVVFAGRNNDDT